MSEGGGGTGVQIDATAYLCRVGIGTDHACRFATQDAAEMDRHSEAVHVQCPCCGHWFVPPRKATYCGTACRMTAYRERKASAKRTD